MAMESGLGSERKTDLPVEMGSVWKLYGKGDGHGERSVLFPFPVFIQHIPRAFDLDLYTI